MFYLLRIPPQARISFSLSQPVAICASRNIFTSAVQQQRSGLTYDQFIDGIGKQFEKANRPRNWLGGDVPFPMNPSFKPPMPISDTLRTTIYTQYMTDPVKNSVRELARRYHLSIKRVDAILRLKGQEESWIKEGKPLQTGFRAGMEKLLGVEENKHLRSGLSDRDTDSLRYDVDQADALNEDEGRDWARQKYRRMFWESTPEGVQEPSMPANLQQAREAAKASRREMKSRKAESARMPRDPSSAKEKSFVLIRPGRPTMKFVDVGGKFLDVRDRVRRMAESERRARVRARKRQKMKGKIRLST